MLLLFSSYAPVTVAPAYPLDVNGPLTALLPAPRADTLLPRPSRADTTLPKPAGTTALVKPVEITVLVR